jgi:hypothetical protein
MRSSAPGHSHESDRSRAHQGGAGLLADGDVLQAWRPVGKDKGERQLSVARRSPVVAEPCMPSRLTMVLVVARARGGGQCGGSRWSSAERRARWTSMPKAVVGAAAQQLARAAHDTYARLAPACAHPRHTHLKDGAKARRGASGSCVGKAAAKEEYKEVLREVREMR